MADTKALVDLLESWLGPDGEKPATTDVQVVFSDGSLSGGKAERTQYVGLYKLTQKAMVPTGNGGAREIEGKMVEVFFTGSDIKRLARVVDVETSGIVIPGGPRRGGLVNP